MEKRIKIGGREIPPYERLHWNGIEGYFRGVLGGNFTDGEM